MLLNFDFCLNTDFPKTYCSLQIPIPVYKRWKPRTMQRLKHIWEFKAQKGTWEPCPETSFQDNKWSWSTCNGNWRLCLSPIGHGHEAILIPCKRWWCWKNIQLLFVKSKKSCRKCLWSFKSTFQANWQRTWQQNWQGAFLNNNSDHINQHWLQELRDYESNSQKQRPEEVVTITDKNTSAQNIRDAIALYLGRYPLQIILLFYDLNYNSIWFWFIATLSPDTLV